MISLHDHKYSFDRSSLGFNKFAASSSKTMFVKPKMEEVKVDVTCLNKDKSDCSNDYEKPKSKAPSRKKTQVKFVFTCHHSGIINHTRTNCFQIRS